MLDYTDPQAIAQFDKEVKAIRKDFEYPHDGPITAFGLLAWACDMVKAGKDPYTVANALHDTLCDFGYLEMEEREGSCYNTADGR